MLKRIPKIRDVVVWNEVNSPQFWPAAGGAAAYEALLADCWDHLRRLRPYVNLISSTAAKYDPAGFMRAVGVAYRASGRKRPIISTFGHNPYPVNAAEPPWVRHDDPANVSQADLPRLLLALHEAFYGTGQPLPSATRPIVWYMENGFQTIVPPSKRRHYTGEETDPWAVPPVAPEGIEPWFRDQASQLRDALLLAHCQNEVGAYFNFELIDEDRLAGWQSGVLWRDGTRKPSYQAFREAVELVQSGGIDCATVPGAGRPDPGGAADRRRRPPGVELVQNACVTTNYERAFEERPDVYAAWGAAGRRDQGEHGPPPLRAGDARRRAAAPLELLLPRPRHGAGGAVRRARPRDRDGITARPGSTRSTSP